MLELYVIWEFILGMLQYPFLNDNQDAKGLTE